MHARTFVLASAAALTFLAGAAATHAEEFWNPQDTRRRDALTAAGDRRLIEAQQYALNASMLGGPRPPPAADYLAAQARTALNAYEQALGIGPETADLHYRAFRAANFIVQFQEPILPSYRDIYEAVIRHVAAVERLAPLDPRLQELSGVAGIAYSKLGALGGQQAETHYEKGIKEYERYRSLSGNLAAGDLAVTYANEAELLMAVGRLDDAIRYYRTSIEINSLEPLAYFGLAVALDRNGEWSKAEEAIRKGEVHSKGVERLREPTVFFVPNGDIHYYYALYHQVRGDRSMAVAEYNRFLERCKETRWAARARIHLAELSNVAEDR